MNALTLTQGKRFAPSLGSTLLMVVVAMGCVRLGQWQQGKAEVKQAAQAVLDAKETAPPLTLTGALVDADHLRYAPVQVVGTPWAAREFLVDNRFHEERAGYHVITPVRLADSDTLVLVNRGWVPASTQHTELPKFATPTQPVTWVGRAVIPSQKFFTLVPDAPIPAAANQWPAVWQNLDFQKFVKAMNVPVQPVVVLLNADQPDGFARDWVRPDDRYEKHWSYAYQWYGFAATAVLIWLALSWRRKTGAAHG